MIDDDDDGGMMMMMMIHSGSSFIATTLSKVTTLLCAGDRPNGLYLQYSCCRNPQLVIQDVFRTVDLKRRTYRSRQDLTEIFEIQDDCEICSQWKMIIMVLGGFLATEQLTVQAT